MPAEICLSTQVLFFNKQKLKHFGQHHSNFTGTNTSALELDARAESLVDKTHEQSLKFQSDSQFRLALKTSLTTLKARDLNRQPFSH